MSWQRYHTFWQRFAAGVIDGIVFWPIGIGLNWLAHASGSWAVSFSCEFLLEALGIAYSVLLHWKKGQTLGKMALEIKVLDVGEERLPTLRQAMLREIGRIILAGVGFLIFGILDVLARFGIASDLTIPAIVLGAANLIWFGLELLTMLLDDKRRALHDHIAETVVVKI